MIFKRAIEPTLRRFTAFPVIGVFGPRQSGKTTLVQQVFNEHTYLNFEDPDIRKYARENPKGFLAEYENQHGIILDEFQYVPEILSYIQLEADAKNRPGYFVLTGSQNFLMNEAVTQSLAGRIGILTLLPLSIEECKDNGILPSKITELMYKGGYPRLYSSNATPGDLYPSYIHSYLERDVRKLINVDNLDKFQMFMQLCAGRIGQLLNISDLAVNCGIDQKTVHSWLSILKASYVIFTLQPYHVNFNKRVTKTTKLYFFDTGLACSLLQISSSEELAFSSFKGPLFENYIIADLYKQFFSLRTDAPLYFWRDLNGRTEVDCLMNLGNRLIPIEIKAAEKIVSETFASVNAWSKIANVPKEQNYLIYAGEHSFKYAAGNLVSWQASGNLVKKLTEK